MDDKNKKFLGYFQNLEALQFELDPTGMESLIYKYTIKCKCIISLQKHFFISSQTHT